ncbi:MAG: hypothetical protein ACT4OJ_05110 [Bacteroidota bacterium]
MRKLFLRLCLPFVGLTIVSAAIAQADVNTEFSNRMNYVFGLLDKSKVPTGLLLDYAMEFADLKSYNGVLTDSNKTNAGLLKDIYSTLLMSGIHTNAGTFYHPDYADSLWWVQRQPGIITLSGLYYNYSRFRDDAVSAGLITVNNERFIDRYIDEDWLNPYQEETVFAVSPPLHVYSGRNLQVKLPSELWFTNNAAAVSSVAVDFNDGAGYRTIQQNQLINISYADTGIKVWTFRLSLTSGTQLYSHTEMRIEPEPNGYSGGGNRFLRPGGPIFLTADEAWNGQTAQGWITVDYANPPDATGRHRLVRPLIVAEGFDPGHLLTPEQQFGFTNFKFFLQQLADPNASPQLLNLLQSTNQQYDIIYVDWAKGTDFLQRNALLLERVIRWVNEEKVLDGTNEPNVVLGQSMGGVIARWALRDMENKSLNHQTRLFISWDGPQLGANIPTTFQHLARHGNSVYLTSNGPAIVFGYNNIIRPFTNATIFLVNGIRSLFNGTPWNEIGSLPSNSQILAGLNLMDVPAARQMLISRINLNGVINNNLHDDWQTELRNLGYPQQSRNIAVSNGSECAIAQGFQPFSTLLYFNGKANTRIITDFLGMAGLPIAGFILLKPQFLLGILPGRNEFFFDFYCKAQPSSGSGQIYKGKIDYRKKILWLVNVNTTLTDRNRYADASVLPIDGSPGGLYDSEVNLTSQSFSNWAIKYNIIANSIPHFNFVPTPSALDIGGGNFPLGIENYNARYVGGNPPAAPLNSQFVNFTTAFNQIIMSNGQINNNENHIQISPRNGNFAAEELNGNINFRTNCEVFCGNGVITGNTTICVSQVLTAPFGNGITYNWSVSNPLLFTLSPSGNTVLVTRNGTAVGQATLTVNISGVCGNTTLSTTITAGTLTPGPITWTWNAPPNRVLLDVDDVPGATSYQWYLDGVLKATTASSYYHLPMSGNVSCGNFYYFGVKAVSSCGASAESYIGAEMPSCGFAFEISPNPSSDNIRIKHSDNPAVKLGISKLWGIEEVEVYDKMGNIRYKQTFAKGTTIAYVSVSKFATDVYTLRIFDGQIWHSCKIAIRH